MSSPSTVRSLPLKFRREPMIPSNKRFKSSSSKNPFWERTNDDESPRRRRMGGMAFHSSSSPSCASSSPMASSSIGPCSSPATIPSSPLGSSVSPISKNRRQQQWLKRKVDWDDLDGDDIGSEVNGLELLLTAIERQHAFPCTPPKQEPLLNTLVAVDLPEPISCLQDHEMVSKEVELLPMVVEKQHASPSASPKPEHFEDTLVAVDEPVSCQEDQEKDIDTPPLPSDIPLPSQEPASHIGLSKNPDPIQILKSEEIIPSLTSEDIAPSPSPSSSEPIKSISSPEASTSTSSSTPLHTDGELTGHIITFLAFGPTSSSTAPDMVNHLMRESSSTKRPKKSKGKGKGQSKEEDEKRRAILLQVRKVLSEGEMFGRIDRPGEDADGMPLEATFHYIPAKDPDTDRASTISALGMKPKRRATIKHVQYHYAPVSLNRYELAAEVGDDG